MRIIITAEAIERAAQAMCNDAADAGRPTPAMNPTPANIAEMEERHLERARHFWNTGGEQHKDYWRRKARLALTAAFSE